LTVNELRKLLEEMPGEMNVHQPGGIGIMTVKHKWRIDLVGGLNQWCEVIPYYGGEDETFQGQDMRLERADMLQVAQQIVQYEKDLKKVKEQQ